jgi:hypothetical protein
MAAPRRRENEPFEDTPAQPHPPAGDADVQQLAERIGEVVDSAPESEREALSEYAVELLREEAGRVRQEEIARSAGPRAAPLGVFGIVALLVLGGGILLFVLPPAGVVLLLLALPVAGLGVMQTLLRRSRAAAPDVDAADE